MTAVKVFKRHMRHKVKIGHIVRNHYVLAEDKKEARSLFKMGKGLGMIPFVEMLQKETFTKQIIIIIDA